MIDKNGKPLAPADTVILRTPPLNVAVDLRDKDPDEGAATMRPGVTGVGQILMIGPLRELVPGLPRPGYYCPHCGSEEYAAVRHGDVVSALSGCGLIKLDGDYDDSQDFGGYTSSTTAETAETAKNVTRDPLYLTVQQICDLERMAADAERMRCVADMCSYCAGDLPDYDLTPIPPEHQTPEDRSMMTGRPEWRRGWLHPCKSNPRQMGLCDASRIHERARKLGD